MSQETKKDPTARAVFRVPALHIHTHEPFNFEIPVTVRPGSSKRNKYEKALVGGKITAEDGDFEGIADEDQLKNPSFILTLDQMIQAGLRASEREVLEELGIVIAPGLLHFVDVSTNKAGWTTYTFATDLPEKPTVLVKPNSAGTEWIDVDRVMNGRPRLLSGHLGMARRAIKYLNSKQR